MLVEVSCSALDLVKLSENMLYCQSVRLHSHWKDTLAKGAAGPQPKGCGYAVRSVRGSFDGNSVAEMG